MHYKFNLSITLCISFIFQDVIMVYFVYMNAITACVMKLHVVTHSVHILHKYPEIMNKIGDYLFYLS